MDDETTRCRLRESPNGARYIDTGIGNHWAPLCRVDFTCSHLPEQAEVLLVDILSAANMTIKLAELSEEAGL